MKNLNLILAGVFFTVAAAWSGLLVTAQVQLGSLGRAPAEEGGPLFPSREPGLAIQGRLVDQDLGCVACHTQQVRPAGQGSDIARGYGVRPSVARDYVLQPTVLLGQNRVGPDLANYGARAKGEAELAAFLAAPAAGVNHPPYAFLTAERSRALVAYLQSLRQDYSSPEAKLTQ
jgi:cytochrome c oxidase cbb3-type subunit 2